MNPPTLYIIIVTEIARNVGKTDTSVKMKTMLYRVVHHEQQRSIIEVKFIQNIFKITVLVVPEVLVL